MSSSPAVGAAALRGAFAVAIAVAIAVLASCGSEDRPPAGGGLSVTDADGARPAGDGGSDGGSEGGTTTQCTNGIDDDGDGLVDALDPECTGPFDNDESTFGSGITSDNSDPCKQDCLFDGNSGQGDDGCDWNLACDPLKPAGAVCEKDAGADDGGTTTASCARPQTQRCRDSCEGRTPNGCDCFGCCSFPYQGGELHVRLTKTCTSRTLGDPTSCARCTPVASCRNSCEPCEICTGKTSLPAGCTKPTCEGTTPTCGADGSCPLGTYCITGCCIVVVR